MNDQLTIQKNDFDARVYQQHSSVQYKIARSHLDRFHFKGSETILDIGCGDGKVTALIGENVPHGKVLGIDKSESMIHLAQETFSHKNFPHLTFEVRDACTFSYENQFDLVTCFSCLHWIKDQEMALKNMKRHLKKNGQAIIVTFPRCISFWDPIEAVAFQPKWKGYFEHNLKPYCFLDESSYASLLNSIGFKICMIETTSHTAKFEGKRGFENYVQGWLPFLLDLPTEFHSEFLGEIGTKSLDYAPVQEDGCVHHPYEKIVMHIMNAHPADTE